MTSQKELEILLVEDDPADIELTREMLIESKLKLKMYEVRDGVEAIKYLRKEPPYQDATVPDLILLDLNMPRKDGRETLMDIKSNDHTKHIPVVILTTSDSNIDIIKSYTTGANCYITKPVGLSEFKKVVDAIESFWFSVVKLPPKK